MCALLATRQARSMVSRELAKKMVVDADSPEVLFAMASFHKFYQQFYRKCLSACDQATLDTHRLVRVPILVFRMLQSLGFCTITDEDGNDILVTDGDGRPVCGWWGSGGGSGLMSDLRAANATYHPPSSLYPITRIGQTINRLVLMTMTPAHLKKLKTEMNALRPTRSSLITRAMTRDEYEKRLEVWELLNNGWNRMLIHAEHAKTKGLLLEAKGAFTAMRGLLENILKNRLSNSKGEWWTRFQKLVEDMLAIINASRKELLLTHPDETELASRKELLLPHPGEMELETGPRITQNWKSENCWKKHGSSKVNCDKDIMCSYQFSNETKTTGLCRDKPPNQVQYRRHRTLRSKCRRLRYRPLKRGFYKIFLKQYALPFHSTQTRLTATVPRNTKGGREPSPTAPSPRVCGSSATRSKGAWSHRAAASRLLVV